MDVQTFIRAQETHRLREDKQDLEFRSALYGGAPSMLARFYVDAYPDDSVDLGYPAFKERVMIFLQAPDSRDSQTYIATSDYREQFPKEWELFVRNNGAPKLPLSAIPQSSPAIIRTFEAMGLKSLEDVIAKLDMPEPLQKYQKWARWIKSAHEASYGRKMKVAA